MKKWTKYVFVFVATLGLWSALMVPTSAGAITIHEFIGNVEIAPVEFSGLDVVRDVENVNGTLHVAGWMNDLGAREIAARQLIDLSTGTAGAVERFDSLSGSSFPRGRIHDILIRSDGSVEYLGNSMSPEAGQTGIGEATVWTAPDSPRGLGFAGAIEGDGAVMSGTPTGTYVGVASGAPVISSGGSDFIFLPWTTGGTAADISADGRFIVGDHGSNPGIWEETAPGSGSYSLIEGLLETPTGTVLSPLMWAVVDDVVFGDYLSLTSFETGIGAWDLNTGAFLQDFGIGEFADAALIDGEIVVGVNGADGGRLSLLGDPSSLLLSDLMGIDDLALARGGLYEGSLGIFAEGLRGGSSVMVTASYSTNAVPEPSTFIMMIGMVPLVLMFRKRFA